MAHHDDNEGGGDGGGHAREIADAALACEDRADLLFSSGSAMVCNA
ncbi:hypothetical protein [Nocardia vinacea]|nr:hypothetical protein [Nocardia vinacea]